MSKKFKIRLHTAVVCVDGSYYVIKVTSQKTMSRLLGYCDNGSVGKTRFIRTRPLFMGSPASHNVLLRYIKDANKNWFSYKPMKFSSDTEAMDYLYEKRRADYTMVALLNFVRN